MRLLFVLPVPAPGKKVYVGYNHGVGYLSACLKGADHDTSCVVTWQYDEALLDEAIRTFKPDVVGLSLTWPQVALGRRIARYCAERHGLAVIAGGAHATLAPDEVLSYPGIRAVCVGEAEHTIAACAEAALDPDGSPARLQGHPATDLDELPLPDREIETFSPEENDFASVLRRHRGIVGAEFVASRGCPYDCSYCCNSALAKATPGVPRLRVRSVGNLVTEVRDVASRFGPLKLVGFHDDIFGLDRGWLEEFAAIFPNEIGLPFWCNARADLVDERFVRLLEKAGCVRVHIGVESGSDHIRNDVLKKNISRDEIVRAFALAKSAGMRTVAFNMLGVPCETEDTLRETVRLNRELNPGWVIVSIFHPYPGSELHNLCVEEGWISGHSSESYYDPTVILDQPSVSRDMVRDYYERFVDLVYGD